MRKMTFYRFLLGVCFVALISGCATVSEVDTYPRYDGFYTHRYKKITLYLRFFEDGHVINANTDGPYDLSINEWFNVNFHENQGTYTITGNKIDFFVESEQGRVEFSGLITRPESNPKKEAMKLKMQSLINGNKKSLKFKFFEGV